MKLTTSVTRRLTPRGRIGSPQLERPAGGGPGLRHPAPDALVAPSNDFTLMNGDEALGRIAMMQFSLHFMLLQQHRRRWEGIMASAMAHMEGFTDLEGIPAPGASPHDDSDTPRPLSVVQFVSGMGAAALVHRNSIVELPYSRPTTSAPADDALSQMQALTLPTSPVMSVVDPLAASSPASIAMRDGVEDGPNVSAVSEGVGATLIVIDAAQQDVGHAVIQVHGPSAIRNANDALAGDEATPKDVAANAATPTLSTVSIASAPVEEVRTTTITQPTSRSPLPSLQAFLSQLDAALCAGAAVGPAGGRMVVCALLATPGGYAELMKRKRLLSCELGLQQYVSREATRWRQCRSTAPQPVTSVHALVSASPSIPTRSSKSLVDALLRCDVWNGAGRGIFEELWEVDTQAALRQLPHLYARFGQFSVDATVPMWVDGASICQPDVLPESKKHGAAKGMKKLGKFSRARK